MAVLVLGKFTGWGLGEMLGLTWPEMQAWLNDAARLAERISASA